LDERVSPIVPFKPSHYAFSRAEALANCVQQQLADICPTTKRASKTICLPTEPLRPASRLQKDKSTRSRYISWLAANHVMYKPHQLRCEQSFPRFVYIDLGAASYDASVGLWFREVYPGHDKFQITAFEADPFKARDWKAHPDIELVKMAAWTTNTSLDFISEGFGAHVTLANLTAQRAAGVKVDLSRLGAKKETKRLLRVPALDIADFLRRRVTREDYVVVKMDVEGAETVLVPHLIASNVTALIDEFFVELHSPPAHSSSENAMEKGEWLRKPLASGQTEEGVLHFVKDLRDAGVYAHQWL